MASMLVRRRFGRGLCDMVKHNNYRGQQLAEVEKFRGNRWQPLQRQHSCNQPWRLLLLHSQHWPHVSHGIQPVKQHSRRPWWRNSYAAPGRCAVDPGAQVAVFVTTSSMDAAVLRFGNARWLADQHSLLPEPQNPRGRRLCQRAHRTRGCGPGRQAGVARGCGACCVARGAVRSVPFCVLPRSVVSRSLLTCTALSTRMLVRCSRARDGGDRQPAHTYVLPLLPPANLAIWLCHAPISACMHRPTSCRTAPWRTIQQSCQGVQ